MLNTTGLGDVLAEELAIFISRHGGSQFTALHQSVCARKQI
jgi:hypothetical protein